MDEKIKVTLVTDIHLLKSILKKKFTVSVCNSELDLIPQLRKQNPQVIVYEFGAEPKSDLDELCRIRGGFRSSAIITIGNEAHESWGLEAIKGGAQDFLCKQKLESDHVHKVLLHSFHRQSLRGSESTEAQQELKRAARVKDEFIAHLSHELRTPMNGIIGMTSILLQHQLPGHINGYVNTVRQSGENMLNIINDLLDLSKIEAGKIELESCRFSLRSLINDTLELFSEQVRGKGILLTSIVSPDIEDQIIADDSRVRQVLANLLANAVKFTDKGAVITRAAYNAKGMIEVRVKDSGIGIPAHHQKLLFKPFTQLSVDPKRNVGGTGLGLAISKKLVELMSGDISCDSFEKKGSEFSFSFKATAIPNQNNKCFKPERSKHTIAIVSTSEIFHKSLEENLNNYGYQDVVMGPSIKTPTLVIIDNQALNDQPRWLTTAKEIRRVSTAPIILVGKLGSDKRKLEELGISSVLKYPLRIPELIQFIDEILEPDVGNNFVARERDRQERISHTFEDLKLRGKMVLVAEDNIINQRVAVSMLEQLGVNSDCVSNGKEAIEAAQNYNYDAILMDCRMPLVDGYEAAKVIRNLSKHYRDCPILAVTANALKSERYKSDDALMNLHISKPITIEQLKQGLESCLSNEKNVVMDGNNTVIKKKCDPEILRSSVLDSVKKVSEKVGNNLLEDVITLFFENSPRLITEIKDAITRQEGPQVGSLAHKLKGSARNLGAIRMAENCTRLEDSGELNNLNFSLTIINEIETDFLAVKELLSERYPIT